ncbi:MAG TPA: DUF6159 family protein [Candidatus Dormibacteraeota bacterium]|nr:DUF6159 family protein [Candidatus Dormibacteraeota bacterium]
MGKIGRSWEMVKQSFAILRADKQLMLLPVLSAISCVLIMVVIGGAGIGVFLPGIKAAQAAGLSWQPSRALAYTFLLLFYVTNYFCVVFFNVALVGVANSHLSGGTWTVRDGLELAWARKWTILQWALVAGTVGMLLRMLEERLGWIGRMITKLIGIAWALASFLVVPVLAFEDLTPFDAVKRSAKLFRETWGEKVVGGFSMGLIFLFLALPALGLWILAGAVGGVWGFVVGGAMMLLYFVLLGVVSSAVQGIFNTALYRYACFKQVPEGFSQEMFTSAWAPKS